MGTEESPSNTGWSGEIRIPWDNFALNEKSNGSVVESHHDIIISNQRIMVQERACGKRILFLGVK